MHFFTSGKQKKNISCGHVRETDNIAVLCQIFSGMRKFRIDQDFLIEHWHTIHTMSILFGLKLSFNIVKLNIYHKISIN